jgi:hypothetical protein
MAMYMPKADAGNDVHIPWQGKICTLIHTILQIFVVLTVDVIESDDLFQAGGMVMGGKTQGIVHVHLPCCRTDGLDVILGRRQTEISPLSFLKIHHGMWNKTSVPSASASAYAGRFQSVPRCIGLIDGAMIVALGAMCIFLCTRKMVFVALIGNHEAETIHQ